MPAWTPDVELDDAIVLKLLNDRFPELGPLQLEFIGEGWDNKAYLVNRSVVFRIPQRRLGGELMEQEIRILPFLSARLDFPIPTPSYIAKPQEGFPYSIAGYPFLPGQTADSIAWTDEERSKNAKMLGSLLATLHAIPTEGSDVPEGPLDELKRADLAHRLPIVLNKLEKLSGPSELEVLARDLARTAQLEGPPRWVHGDLYARHLLADQARSVCGIIDWGDVHLGDPALDIAVAWMFLPACSWPAFKAAYGALDEATWRRARFRALTHWCYLTEYAQERGDQHLLGECEFLLKNVLTDY